MIYLDNSATTWPKPAAVRSAVMRGMTDMGANPGRSGHAMAAGAAEAVYACRRTAAELFGAPGPECVLFQPSCTQALNLVIKSVLSGGGHAVISDLEHNAVLRPVEKMKEAGAEYTIAKVIPGDNDATVDEFRRALRPDTKLAVCTGASNVWGIRPPVERIAALCAQYGVKFCVDAAQSGGVIPLSMADSGIDYLCCAGHKGLYGPMGTGMLILGNSGDKLSTLIEGGTGVNSASRVQPEDPPERYESGTLNVPGILGLRAGMELVRRRGPENIYREEMRLIGRLYDRLRAVPGVRLFTGRPEAPYFAPVLSLNIEGMASETVGAELGRMGIAVRCGLHCAPLAHGKFGTGDTGAVRMSPSIFTTAAEIDAASGAAARIAARAAGRNRR